MKHEAGFMQWNQSYANKESQGKNWAVCSKNVSLRMCLWISQRVIYYVSLSLLEKSLQEVTAGEISTWSHCWRNLYMKFNTGWRHKKNCLTIIGKKLFATPGPLSFFFLTTVVPQEHRFGTLFSPSEALKTRFCGTHLKAIVIHILIIQLLCR